MIKKIVIALSFGIIFLGAILRLYHFTTNPPGLYIDETAIGYNAFSILKTGKDEWGTSFPLLFRSFDDFKPPLYIYTVVPFIKVFGLSETAVRLPSILTGIATIPVVMLLLWELLNLKEGQFSKKTKIKAALVSGLLIAISPWHLQFSRAGFEATMSLFFLILGLWLFFYSLRTGRRVLFLSVLAFVASMYAYHSARIVTPLLVVLIGTLEIRRLLANRKNLILAVVFGLIVFIPIGTTYFSKEGQARFSGENVFHQPGNFLTNIQDNYLASFSADFLFFKGDQAGRHSVKKIGELYIWQLPVILVGIYFLAKKRNKLSVILFGWVIIGAIPPSLTSVSPHAIRSLMMVVPLELITVVGFFNLSEKLLPRIKIPVLVLFTLAAVYCFALYLHLYYIHYPISYATDWQNGDKETIEIVEKLAPQYNKIFFYQELSYIDILFYTQFDPATFQKNHDTKNIGKFHFQEKSTFPPKENPVGKTLVVFPFWMISADNPGVIREVRMINTDPLFRLYEQ